MHGAACRHIVVSIGAIISSVFECSILRLFFGLFLSGVLRLAADAAPGQHALDACLDLHRRLVPAQRLHTNITSATNLQSQIMLAMRIM